jgi:PAS domain S-box-containing protein
MKSRRQIVATASFDKTARLWDAATGPTVSLALADSARQAQRESEAGRREEQVRAESDERFRATFFQAAVGISHIGLDGEWLLFNERYCQMLGYTAAELCEKTLMDITHPDDREAALTGRRQLLAGEISSNTMEKRYLRKDRSIFWASLYRTLAGATRFGRFAWRTSSLWRRRDEPLSEAGPWSARGRRLLLGFELRLKLAIGGLLVVGFHALARFEAHFTRPGAVPLEGAAQQGPGFGVAGVAFERVTETCSRLGILACQPIRVPQVEIIVRIGAITFQSLSKVANRPGQVVATRLGGSQVVT